jgi:Rrf2 family protein
MRLTSATRHALRALVHLARHGGGRMLASAAIAEAEGLPDRFLVKVLAPLVRADVLHSAGGPGGGYRLARPAKGITLLEVVEAVEGPVRGEAPTVGADAAGAAFDKRLQAVCDKAAEVTRERLRRVSLADLAGGG